MARPVRTVTPAGEEIVILSAADYDHPVELAEDALDSAIAAAALARLDAGEETFTSEEVDEFLAAPTPLAFWRKRRGIGLDQLAAAIGGEPSAIGELEAGTRIADRGVYERLAEALDLKADDLIPIDPDDSPESAALAIDDAR